MIPGGGIWPIALGDTPANAAMRLVSPDYFATMGIPMREGREMAENDTLDAPPVAVVSESFARRYWPNQGALGRKFHFGFANFPFGEQERTIVGIVGDVRFRGLERSNETQVYLSYKQLPDRVSTFYAPREFVVRYMGDTAAIVAPIQRIIRAADAELPISAVRPMQDIVDQQTASREAQMRLVAIFGALALFLAGTGIYGLLSFAVGQRSQEFGLRLALGANTRDICAMVVKEGSTLATIGALCGVVLSYFAGRAMQALLAGVGPLDPAAIAAAAVFALAMTLSGTIVPAIRAMRTDPAIVIRGE